MASHFITNVRAFDDANDRSKVFWAGGQGPYDNTRKALANIDLSAANGKRVLLKPNIGRNVEAGRGVTTHPQVVAAAIDAFVQAGACVAVGESPIVGVKMAEAFQNSGTTAVCTERKCRLLDMDVQPFLPVEVPDGIAIKSLKVCRDLSQFDIVVSIPVMKTHMHTGVTLSVKNMKGCLWRRSKVDLHMLSPIEGHSDKPLDIAIADMASVLLPALSIIDGTVGLEGLGPSAGEPKELGVVVVGIDAFATDAVGCGLMGIEPCDVPHLRLGANRGLGQIDLEKIEVSPANWQDAARSFALPPKNLSLEFAGFNILDRQSCSACQSTLMMFLKRYGKEILEDKKDGQDITIAIGKGHGDLNEGTLCVGSCMAGHKECGVFVPGCPPVASEIAKAFKKIIDY